jgi:hypothetical protein
MRQRRSNGAWSQHRVGIDNQYDFTGAFGERKIDGRDLAAPDRKAKNLVDQPFRLQLFDDAAHAIGRSIVDEDDLIRLDRFHATPDRSGFIVSSHDSAGREPDRRQLLSSEKGDDGQADHVARYIEQQREPE